MPELLNIDDWAAVNDVSDSVDKWAGFTNYMREEFFKEGLTNEELRETFNGINESIADGAQLDNVSVEQLNEALAPKAPSFNHKLQMVDRAWGGLRDPEDRRILIDYQASERILQEDPNASEATKQNAASLRAQVEEVVNDNYDDAVQWSLNNSDVPYARVELSDGTIQLQAGDAAIGLTAYEAYAKSLAAGTVTPNDIPVIAALSGKDANGYENFRHYNFKEAYTYLNNALRESDFLQKQISYRINKFSSSGEIDKDSLESLAIAFMSEDDNAKQFSKRDIIAALEFQIGYTAQTNGSVKFDEDNLSNNIKSFGYGNTTYHRELLEDETQFKEAIKGLSDADKEVALSQREAIRETLFVDFSDSLSHSYLGDQWAAYYADRKGSASDPDILDEFVKKTDYSFKNKLQHLALAVGEGFTDLVWSVGAVAGNDTSREFLLENLKDRKARTTVARLFGQDFGFGTELTATAAPIIADIIATSAITTATGGIGATAALGAVGFKNSLKTAGKAISREAAEKAASATAKKAISDVAPSAFLKEYSKIVNNKVLKTTAVSGNAGLRSGGMTYASVYDALSSSPEGKNLSKEELHEKSLAAAGTAFLITSTLVGAFGIGKFGGIESYIANGATTKQVVGVLERLGKVKLTDQAAQKALTNVLRGGHKKLVDSTGKRILLGGVGEALEEGLDEYLNTIAQASFTNSSLSFKDLATAAGMGAVYGGILGSAIPAVSAGYSKTFGRLDVGAAEIQTRRQVAELATEEYNKLQETNSPETAREFLKKIYEAEASPAQAPKASPAQAPKAEGAAAKAEGAASSVLDDAIARMRKNNDNKTTVRDGDGFIDRKATREKVAKTAADLGITVEEYANQRAAESREAARDFYDSLEDGDIVTWTDGGMTNAAEVKVFGGNPPLKEVRSTTGFIYVRESTAFSVNADQLSVTRAAPKAEEEALAVEAEALSQYDEDAANAAAIALEEASELDIKEAIEDVDAEENPTAPDTTGLTSGDLKKFEDDSGATPEQIKQGVEDLAEVSEKGQSAKPEPEPVTVEAKTEAEKAAVARLEELLQIGYPVNLSNASGYYGFPRGVKDFLASKASSFEEALLKLQNDKDSELFVLRTKEDVAEAFGYDPKTIEVLRGGFKHNTDGYLFDNNPVTMNKLLEKGHSVKVPKGFNYNRNLFVVEEGVLIGINKPTFNANSTKAKQIKSGEDLKLVANAINFNSAIEPSDITLNFSKSGLYSSEADAEFILDGVVSHKEAVNKLNEWISNPTNLGLLRRFSGIDQTDLTDAEKADLFADVLNEFYIELNQLVSIEALRQTVGDLVTEGDATKLSDNLLESGLFNQTEIDDVLSKLDKVQFETGTTPDSDLLSNSTTPKQKLATFLYYTNKGVQGKKNPYSDTAFRANVDGTAKRKRLKAGWEDQIIFRSVESALSESKFRREEGRPYPNLPKLAGSVGDRSIKRAKATKKLPTTEITESILKASSDPVDNNTYHTIVGRRVWAIIDSLRKIDSDKRAGVVNAFLNATAEVDPSFNQEDLLRDFEGGVERILTAAISAVARGEKVSSSKFQESYDLLTKEMKGALVSFGLEPPSSVSKNELDSYLLARDAILDYFVEAQAPNLISFKKAEEARATNNATVDRLGLVDGDPESVVNALEEIAKSGVDESHRLIAQLLLKNKTLIRNTNFRIVDNPRSQAAGSFVKFEGERNRVSVNVSAFYGSGIESVLLHEYLHAATFDLIRSGNLNTKQRAALQRLEGLRQMVADNYRKSGRSKTVIEQGILNIDEFIATSFTSASFQNEIRRLPESGLFRRILNAIKSLFGIQTNTRLAKAFDDLADFMNMDVSPATVDIDTTRRTARSEAEATLMKYSEGIRARVETAKNRRFTSIESLNYDRQLTAEQQQAVDEIINEVIKETVPADIPVIELDPDQAAIPFEGREKSLFSTQVTQLGGKEVVTIFVNRRAAQTAMFDLVNEVTDDLHARMIFESILNEEITHAAELRTIPIEEIDAVADGMSLSDFDKVIQDYTESASLRRTLREGIQSGDVDTRRTLVGEKLRMEVQKINRGYTTEQDKAFYISSPKFYQVMLRYLKGFFKKMYAKYNLRKDNPEMARMVNQMSYEIQLLRGGVFHIRQNMKFDISTPDLVPEFLNQRFSATFENDKLKEITAETTDEEIYERFPFLRGFELPVGVFKDGKYQSNQKFAKFLNGELDPRILELRRQADALQSSIDGRTERIMNEVMELVQNNPEATNELLGDFLGRADEVEVPYEFRDRRRKVAFERLDREKSEKGRPLSDSERDAIVEEEVDEAVIAEETKLRNEAVVKKEAAKIKLSQTDPKLFEKLSELRLLLDALSKKFSSTFDTQGDLRATIDANLGIYIVRSYRAFLEEGYMDKVIKIVSGEAVAGDEQMVKHYQQVYELFEEEYHNAFARTQINKERAESEPLEQRASKDQLIEDSKLRLANYKEQGRDPVRGAILEYLYSLDPNSRFKNKAAPLATSVTKSLVDRVRSRKSVPEAFRKLLGQYDNSDVVENVLRSITMVSQAATKESFLRNIIQFGRRDDSKFAYTLKEVRQSQAQGIDLGLVNLRTGARADTVDIEEETLKDETEQSVSDTKNYYVPKEMFADIQKQFQRNVEGSLASHSEFVESSLRLAKYAVGASLAAKTLFSFGFYFRNYLGNVGFFAPLVGLNPIKVAASILKIKGFYKNNLEGLDEYTSELVMLNVAHGDLTSNTIKELLQGKRTLKDLQEEAEALVSKADALLKLGKTAYDKAVQPVMKRAVALSQAVDSAYKMVYFENELEVMKKARDEDIRKGIEVGQGYNLSDYDLKVKAAHAVRQTSQSYVDAYEAVKYATGKYSFLLPPFIRFRMDIIRILFDGLPKRIKEELSSDNAVIKSRGVKRLAGATFTVGGISMVIPLLTRTLLAGLSDEEDELLRETLPDWQKNATLFYTGKDSFIDLTYVNPISGVTNIFYQSLGEIFDGKPVTGFMKALSLFKTEYGGSQIVSSAIMDAKANRDPRTGEKIYEEDGSFGSFANAMTYIYKQAYDPRAFSAARNIASTISGDVPLDPKKSTLGLVARELLPFRTNTIEWDRVFQRAVGQNKDKRNRMGTAIDKLKSRASLTDGDISDAVDTFVNGQKEAAQELSRFIESARSVGVSRRQIESTLSYYKLPKEYIGDVRRGLFRRPELPKSLVEDLRARGDETSASRFVKARDLLMEGWPRVEFYK